MVVLHRFSRANLRYGIFHLVLELKPGFIPLIFSSIIELRFDTNCWFPVVSDMGLVPGRVEPTEGQRGMVAGME